MSYKENGYEDCSGVEECGAENTGHMFCHTPILKTKKDNIEYIRKRKIRNLKYKIKSIKRQLKELEVKK